MRRSHLRNPLERKGQVSRCPLTTMSAYPSPSGVRNRLAPFFFARAIRISACDLRALSLISFFSLEPDLSAIPSRLRSSASALLHAFLNSSKS